jgi:16S rRNA (guanine527-N7)-methyltransferase
VLAALESIADKGARNRLSRYLASLVRWSRNINLTGAETERSIFDTLIHPVLGGESLLSGHVIDVGSGNGSPGLVLAALRPDLRFTLLEPRAKRWAFLRDAVRDMAIANVAVIRARSDSYQGSPGRTVTIRAVGLGADSLRPLLEGGSGDILFFGGPDISGAEALKSASGSRIQRVRFT